MTKQTWTPWGGTDGTNTEGALSVANSGGVHGTAVTHVIIANTSTPAGDINVFAYRTAAGPDGVKTGVRCLPSSSSHLRLAVDPSPTSMKWGMRFPWRWHGTTVDVATVVIANPRDTADAQVGDLRVNTSEMLVFFDKTSAAISAVGSGALFSPSPEVDYEIEAYWTVEATGTAGQVGYKVYLAGGTVPVGEYVSTATVNLGTVQPNRVRLGTPAGTVTGMTSWDFTGPIDYGTMATLAEEFGPSAVFQVLDLTVNRTSSTTDVLDWSDVSTATGYDVEANGVIVASNIAASTYTHTHAAHATVAYRVRPVK